MPIPQAVNVYEAKTQLSKLIDRALAGEEVVIARAGTPLVRLVPFVQPDQRVPGSARGQIRIGEDFDDVLPEGIADAFNGAR
ncbi:type II toxin-antitoxin system Phd/YefM family antitoxin [soil metagenome]